MERDEKILAPSVLSHPEPEEPSTLSPHMTCLKSVFICSKTKNQDDINHSYPPPTHDPDDIYHSWDEPPTLPPPDPRGPRSKTPACARRPAPRACLCRSRPPR